jgi:hypothetical protein
MSAMRKALESSWRGALLRIEIDGALHSTSATYAGQLLQVADGDAERAPALSLVLAPPGSVNHDKARRFFADAREHLATVLAEERADRGPQLKTG